ncbi:hypothetical protein LRS71_05960 [Rhodococcus pyridinivorans]|uniref:hypothetical protein n=1 Tax=Rhodococcus pyridinivorans TaxID=103816 RepID=UPI001E2A1533|nr:hypothetical protein [Rhodococcus pyridinivorans]MCD5419106.1 hypothetical protein [Rhodococcus pyridinivorans]
MTTEEAQEEQAGSTKATLTEDRFAAPDLALQYMAGFADRARAGVPIKLVLSGSIISGIVCGGEEFFEWAAERHRSAQDTLDPEMTELSEWFAKTFFDAPATEYRERRESLDENSEPDDTKNCYIHLRDAVVVNGPHVTQLGFTRVLLSQVAAWTIGRIS